MTTVHLTNAYHPASGGIRTFYHALIAAANREQRRVVLIVPGERTEDVDVGQFGRICFVGAPRAPAFDPRYRTLLPHRFLPLLASRVVDILAQERPRLVEICYKYSLPYLAAMLRTQWHPRVPRPVLAGLTCERMDDNLAAYVTGSRPGRAFARWYVRHIYGPPFDVHVAISEYTAAELRAALPERPAGFVRVSPLGVDAERYGPEQASGALRAELLRRAGGTPGSVLLFYAGRLSPEKNIRLLLAALRELTLGGAEDFRLAIAGDGPLLDWIRAQRRGVLRRRIHLLGNLRADALARHYASCDVFIHPNPREPFGIGPLEAMASGVPVVLPAAGGVLEYATSSNAWLADPRPAAFAAAIRAAAQGDPHRLAAARDTARRFTWAAATRRYFALYDELVEASRQPHALGACPSNSMGRAHGACEARSRREKEAMRDIADDEQR